MTYSLFEVIAFGGAETTGINPQECSGFFKHFSGG
jgi:hypothetical protein